jgi:hypothetical protein
MHRINPDIDIVAQVLQEVRKARPDDAFCKSIADQYMERGSLSKKQLEGLFGKAQRVETVGSGKLATLEAIIKKKVTKERAPATIAIKNDVEKDTLSGGIINSILEKYPAHKRVLFLKTLYDKTGILSEADKNELLKFNKILTEKK